VGQTLSEVNKRLNPLFFAAEPYFENYFGRIGYRFGSKSYIDIRVDRRIRETNLSPKVIFIENLELIIGIFSLVGLLLLALLEELPKHKIY
jgi:hypothetical protein